MPQEAAPTLAVVNDCGFFRVLPHCRKAEAEAPETGLYDHTRLVL